MSTDGGVITSTVPPKDVTGIDTPDRIGPFPDTIAVSAATQVPELADDSKMAMAWWMQQLQYTTFSGKAKAHFESPEENRDFTLNVRIESGKKIWMSVVGSALGISMEAFRAVLTPDSMIAINRIDKEVIRAPFSEIASLFPVQGDFYMLEAVLVGGRIPAAQVLRPIVGSENPEFTVAGSIDSGSTAIGSQTVFFRNADSTMSGQWLQQNGTETRLSYDNYTVSGDRKFSRKRGVSLKGESGTQALNLEYTTYSFDEPVDVSITIPERYKQR